MDIEIGDLVYHPNYKSIGIVIELFSDNLDWWRVEWYNIHGKMQTLTEYRINIHEYKRLIEKDKKWLKEYKAVIE